MAELYITISVIFKAAGYSNNCTEQRFELQCILIEAPHKMVILGDMKELGEASREEHQKVVDYLKVTTR